MSTTVIAPPKLTQLAARANGKHREAYQAAMTMLYAGIDAGEALTEAKRLVGHGGWLKWCDQNLEFATTSACNYMLVAKHKDRILAQDGVDTMQKALRYLKANKLTSQTRIDDARIAEMRAMAAEHGITKAARLLGETFSTVRVYAQGFEKTKHVRPPTSGRQIEVTPVMIDRLAAWIGHNLCNPPREPDNQLARLAHQALHAALRPGFPIPPQEPTP